MKRLAPLAVAAALATSGCYGSYSAARALHRWNGHATKNKYVNSGLHFAMSVIPVYFLVAVGDFLIFNNVEFFTNKPVFGGGGEAAPAGGPAPATATATATATASK